MHPAHPHTHVNALHHNRYTLRLQCVLQCLSDLSGHSLLNLQAPGEHVYQPGNLRQSDDGPVGDICHMGLAEERQQVMLTQAVELNIFDHDHVIIVFAKNRPVQQCLNIYGISASKIFERLCRPVRSSKQAFPSGILSGKG